MRTTTRDIIKIIAELAKMDRRGKLEVWKYLQDELEQAEAITYQVGGTEQ